MQKMRRTRLPTTTITKAMRRIVVFRKHRTYTPCMSTTLFYLHVRSAMGLRPHGPKMRNNKKKKKELTLSGYTGHGM